jgi:hypothetical protein
MIRILSMLGRVIRPVRSQPKSRRGPLCLIHVLQIERAPDAERIALEIVDLYGEDRGLSGVKSDPAEAERAADLIEMELAGKISDLRWRPYFEVQIAAQDYCRYTADSSYWRDGEFVVEEVERGQEDTARLLQRKAAELYCRMKVALVGMSAEDFAAV